MPERTDSSRLQPLGVFELTSVIKANVEQNFNRIWLKGEISNFRPASSGHWYLSLKDSQAQIRATMWRSATQKVSFRPKDGMEVLVFGSINVYAPRGEYAIIIEHIEALGVGKLKAEFQRLKKKLAAEGLFDEIHKKQLPYLPRKVGIVTSKTGAALQDILRVLSERFRGLHIVIAPARVQGDGAAKEIVESIRYLDRKTACDVIIIGRGGGSEEDLWPFNEEIVARAVFAAKTPIISAVGHETDFSISDFCADLRAATPSNAAELVVHTFAQYSQGIHVQRARLDRRIREMLLFYRNKINFSENSQVFVRTRSRIFDASRRLSDIENRMVHNLQNRLRVADQVLAKAQARLKLEHLKAKLQHLGERYRAANQRLPQLMKQKTERAQHKLGSLIHRLDDLSPSRVLARGFSVVYNHRNHVIRKPQDVQFGEVVHVQVEKGKFHARVIEISEAVQPGLFDTENE